MDALGKLVVVTESASGAPIVMLNDWVAVLPAESVTLIVNVEFA
jgi:hypothetical protein